MKKSNAVVGLLGLMVSLAVCVVGADSDGPTRMRAHASVSSTTTWSLIADYENVVFLGVFPSVPIASLTVHVTADAYGDDDASCSYFGPGSEPASWFGARTFSYTSLPGGVLDRTQGVMMCSYYTHEPFGSLTPSDFHVRNLVALDASSQAVPVQLCVLDFSEDDLPVPSEHDCRHACGDAICNGGEPTAADALEVLYAAVGTSSCDLTTCDATGDGVVASSDALATLERAVGIARSMLCRPSHECLAAE